MTHTLQRVESVLLELVLLQTVGITQLEKEVAFDFTFLSPVVSQRESGNREVTQDMSERTARPLFCCGGFPSSQR